MTKKFHPLIILITGVLLLISITAAAAQTTPTLPSGKSAAELADALDAYIQKNEATTAGLALSVFQNGETLYHRNAGFTKLKEQTPVDDETVFEWGSVTKLLVWVSAMQLSEQGKLNLEGDICQYLPENYFSRRTDDEPITMLNLMNHNAGWQDMMLDIFVQQGQPVESLESFLKRTEPPQVFPVGDYTAYSNYGAAIAGLVIERISGQPFADYVRANIFEPLGMAHTALLPDLSDNPWVQEQRKKIDGYTTVMDIFCRLTSRLANRQRSAVSLRITIVFQLSGSSGNSS